MKFQNIFDLCVICKILQSKFRVSSSPDRKRGRQTILHWETLADLFELKDNYTLFHIHQDTNANAQDTR